MILTNNIAGSGTVYVGLRSGSGSVDTGNNYSDIDSLDGGVFANTINSNFIITGCNTTNPQSFELAYASNLSNKEKLFQSWQCFQNTAGAGTAPRRIETYGKWVNTSNALDSLTYHNSGGGDMGSGSEIVVLGWDTTDTHTTNFWEELGSTVLGSAGTDLDITSFTAKKYLWVQVYLQGTAFAEPTMTFNNDTTTYSWRRSANGGADSTSVSQAHCGIAQGIGGGAPMFYNMFIVNNSANEKLGISHGVSQFTAGAGNVPDRNEVVFKWDETASQISRIDINSSSGNFGIGSTLKVWGSN